MDEVVSAGNFAGMGYCSDGCYSQGRFAFFDGALILSRRPRNSQPLAHRSKNAGNDWNTLHSAQVEKNHPTRLASAVGGFTRHR